MTCCILRACPAWRGVARPMMYQSSKAALPASMPAQRTRPGSAAVSPAAARTHPLPEVPAARSELPGVQACGRAALQPALCPHPSAKNPPAGCTGADLATCAGGGLCVRGPGAAAGGALAGGRAQDAPVQGGPGRPGGGALQGAPRAHGHPLGGRGHRGAQVGPLGPCVVALRAQGAGLIVTGVGDLHGAPRAHEHPLGGGGHRGAHRWGLGSLRSDPQGSGSGRRRCSSWRFVCACPSTGRPRAQCAQVGCRL